MPGQAVGPGMTPEVSRKELRSWLASNQRRLLPFSDYDEQVCDLISSETTTEAELNNADQIQLPALLQHPSSNDTSVRSQPALLSFLTHAERRQDLALDVRLVPQRQHQLPLEAQLLVVKP